jgi:mannose/fructose/N-acetylgalactosamine-specific phosphotransferase system component IIB
VPIVLARIDDRLIHGQVSVGWSRHLRADRIVVVSDEAAADPAAAALMALGTPEGLAFECVAAAEAAARWAGWEAEAARTIVLAASPAVFASLVRAGAPVRDVNLGGLHPPSGGTALADGVYAGPGDLEALRDLVAAGVRVEVKTVPSAAGRPLENVMAEGAKA